MLKIINTENIPIKLWLSDIEEGALKQAKDIANLPFAYHHIAIMADAHQGFGMPIGGVLAAIGNIVPNAVGVDIGCGMCAVKTSLVEIDKNKVKKFFPLIRKKIPVGFSHHKKNQNPELMPVLTENLKIVKKQYKSALKQLGTLGGGNHFIEIQKGEKNIWIMIHSGSRNMGLRVADYYHKLAVDINRKKNKDFVKQLAFLRFDSIEGQNYFAEMNYCLEFAYASRKLMMNVVLDILKDEFETIEFEPLINIAHNYAVIEKHFGKSVIVHRKGATSAKIGQIGIIPGSQGTNSYIISGKGNKESFNSCSHGAGRVMGRKQAQRELNLENEINNLSKKNIIHSIKSKKDLDEAPSAYKNIEKVMENQKDLVNILVKLKPLAVIKG